MKKLFITILTGFLLGSCTTQDNTTQDKNEIPMNKGEFIMKEDQTWLLKSEKNGFGIYINTNKWSYKTETINPSAEYEFELDEGDLYGMMINERIEVPIEKIPETALKFYQSVSPDAHFSHKEYRIVNGNKVMQVQINATVQGINFIYLGYYFSNEKGTTQIMTYTSQNLFDSYQKEMEEFLNGFVANRF